MKTAWILTGMLVALIGAAIVISVGVDAKSGTTDTTVNLFNATDDSAIRSTCRQQKNQQGDAFDCTITYDGRDVDCEEFGVQC